MCLVLPFLRLRSRQSLMVMRLSVRKSYSCLEEKAWRSDSRPASRVFALKYRTQTLLPHVQHLRRCSTVFVFLLETYLLSIRLSIHCFSLSSVSSCAVCTSTCSPPVLPSRHMQNHSLCCVFSAVKHVSHALSDTVYTPVLSSTTEVLSLALL